MNRFRLTFRRLSRLDNNLAVHILISSIFLIAAFGKLSLQDVGFFQKSLTLFINILIIIILIKKIENRTSEKSILFLLFSPSFIIIHYIYDNNIYILWDLFFLSICVLYVKFKDYKYNYLLSLLLLSICLIIDLRIIFLSPIIFYCIFRQYSAGASVKGFLIFCLPIYVGALTHYRNSFLAPSLSSLDYVFIALNSLIAIAPLLLFGYARLNWAVGLLGLLGLAPLILTGLSFYFSIYCFVCILTFISLLNLPNEKFFRASGPSSLGVVLLGALLWALPLKDSTHFRAGVFVDIVHALSAPPTIDPLGHPFWHRVGKQYSSAIIGNFYAVQKRVGREDFIFYFKRASNIQNVEYKSDLNWRPLGAAQSNGRTLYILDDWASNPELVIFFDPRRDLLATIDGYSVFVPGWVACKDGCPEISKGLPLDWQVYKSWPEVDGGLLIQRVPPEFNSASKVFFDVSGKGLPMLLEGWSLPEGWGIWTQSADAGILIPYSDHRNKRLVLNVRALINEQHPLQVVSVYLNGAFQNRFELTKGEGNFLTINLDAIPLADKYFKVELKIDRPRSPRELGLGEDARKLGVGLVSAQFK